MIGLVSLSFRGLLLWKFSTWHFWWILDGWMTCHILEIDGFQSPCDFDDGSIVWHFDESSTVRHFDDKIQDFGFEVLTMIHLIYYSQDLWI